MKRRKDELMMELKACSQETYQMIVQAEKEDEIQALENFFSNDSLQICLPMPLTMESLSRTSTYTTENTSVNMKPRSRPRFRGKNKVSASANIESDQLEMDDENKLNTINGSNDNRYFEYNRQ